MAGKLDGRKDYSLGENVPVENIDAQGPGRYYPDDYSAQISMYQRQNQYKGSIPESFAKIITDIDDYAITAHSLENETDRMRQEELNKADLAIQKLNMQTDVGNQAYDQYKRVLSDLDDARNRALADEKLSVEAAYQEVLDANKNIESLNSPYASALWSHMHNTLATSVLPKAREIDTSTIQYQMAANLSDAASSIRSQIMQGGIGIEDGMNQFAVAMYPYLKQLPSRQKDELFRKVFDSFVRGKADYLEVFFANDPDTLIKSLAALRDDFSKKEFKFYNDKNEVLLGEDGSELSYTVGLDYSTQSALTRAMMSARNRKASSEGKIDTVSRLQQAFETSTGLNDLKKNLVSDTARDKSDMQLHKSTISYLNGLQQLGDAKALHDAWGDAAVINTYVTMREISKDNPAAIPAFLDSVIAQLENDVNSTETDFSSYSLAIPSWSGKDPITFKSFADVCMESGNSEMLGADSYNYAQAYYQNMLGSLKQYRDLARSSTANLLDAVDTDYHKSCDTLSKSVDVANLLKFKNGAYVDNPEGQKEIITNISDALMSGENKVGSVLPDSCFADMFRVIDSSADSEQARNAAYMQLGATMGKAPGGGEALARYFLNGHRDMPTQMALSGLLLSGQESMLNDAARIYALKVNNPKEYEATLNKFRMDNPNFAIDVGEYVEDSKIPNRYAGMVEDTMKHLMMAGHSKNKAQSAIDKNFVRIDGPMVDKTKIFIYTPAYQKWGSDSKLIAKTMEKTINNVAEVFPNIKKQHNLAFSVSENGETFELYSDGGRVSASFSGQDVGNGVYLYNPAELNCIKNPEVASFISAHAAAAQMNGLVAQSFAGSMKDHMKKYRIKPEQEAEEKKKILAKAVSARDLNTLRNMAVDRVQGKEVSLNNYKSGEIQCPAFGQAFAQYMHGFGEAMVNEIQNPHIMQPSDFLAPADNMIQSADKMSEQLTDTAQRIDTKKQEVLQDLRNKPKALYKKLLEKHQGFINKAIEHDAAFSAELEARTSYVNKINQADVSAPLSFAAKGIPEYFDKLNASKRAGYNVSGAYLPGVTQSEGTATGFGASIFYVSKNSLPEGLGADYDYSREEINAVVESTASAFGVDPKLIHAIIKHESGYQQRVRGGSGEYGYMQLMPETARNLGVKDPLDGQQNIWGGTKLLAENIRAYGDLDTALVAYNGGKEAVDAWRSGHPWSDSVRYVKSVRANMGNTNYKYEYIITHSAEKNYNKFFDADTGKLSARKMNDFKYNLLNDPVYSKGIKQIETNLDEIWTRPDLAFLRDMKNAEGRTLFKKGDYNGFKVTMARENTDMKNGAYIAAGGLGQDMANTQSSLLPQMTSQQLEALATAFSDRYSNQLDLSKAFGMANLTAQEYNDYGVPLDMLENPVLQSRVLAQEFQRAVDLLGNERKAVYALAGGTMADSAGEIKSWAQIKQDKEAFTKTWFISPSNNKQEREQANILLAQYQNELRKIRGY